MRPHLRHVWVMGVCLFLGAPLAVLSPVLVSGIVDDAQGSATSGDLSGRALILVGMTALSVGLGILIGRSTTLFHNRVRHGIRRALFDHLQRLSPAYHQARETGYLMARQAEDVDNLRGATPDVFVNAAASAVKGLAFLGMLFWVEWRLALGGVLLILVVFGLQWIISGPLRRRDERVRESRARLSETLHQAISGQALTVAAAAERREGLRFLRALHANVRAEVRKDLFAILSGHLMFLITGVAPVLIILAGAFLIAADEFSVGGLFAFFMYLVSLAGSVAEVARLNPALQSSLASLGRIIDVLDTEVEIQSPPDAHRVTGLRGELRFEGVAFEYEAGRPVLQEIDLSIAPRTTVALVGRSGAGKTTLAQLIPRLHDPTWGRILVDGRDLRSLDLPSYRRRVGVVPQSIFLFDRSVRENILFGVPDATEEQLLAAVDAANLSDVVAGLPDGLDTLIGERGTRLSGGQRQRVAIAREILRDPALLILDEATSSLDAESEAQIQEALARLLDDRTALVIAHRLSTIRGADRILVLDEGRVVADGTHEELFARDGLYRTLYRTQLIDGE